eukprot:CAMPEP_0197321132 /NCGR_PEP_ID=MMETSP0891-20130614/63411_1 /TAXON_ID=44058 ORGANISM="Aureoumbra lagunensis, Strain CCMP1510" /NCGR_SAMPLE_ID=MMETSP0891 /ASSEMBLY_ACC=CAM_ASM_000534 /LENGTH=538 /DNA_ID=CAMNT_0042812845 /DNA_START=38 /DNA_END=1651 /DNA_ORIENTATION=+
MTEEDDQIVLNVQEKNIGSQRRFATAIIKLYVSDQVDEKKLRWFLRGIGNDLKNFTGFTSRKIVELPNSEKGGKNLMPILKFCGLSAEEAYANLMRWNQSEELAKWMQIAQEIGLIMEGRDYSKRGVGRISLELNETKSLEKNTTPPLWKKCIIIEFWVFWAVVFHGAAGTTPSLQKAFGNKPFTLLVVLSSVVPVLVYCALPLTLSIPLINKWAHMRISNPEKTTSSCLQDFLIVLEDGFGLFAIDKKTNAQINKLQNKIETLERRINLVSRRQERALHLTTSQHSFEQGLTQIIKEEHRVSGLGENNKNISSSQQEVKSDTDYDEDDLTTTINEADEGGISVAARHWVRWGCQDEFENWVDAISDAMRDYPGGGFLGSDVFREQENDQQIYVTLFRFATVRQLQNWLDSDTRAQFLLKLQPYVESVSDYATLGSSLRLVAKPLDLDSSSRAQRNFFGELLFHESTKPPTPPPLYKTCILIILGLFLVAWIISTHLNQPLEHNLPHFLLATLCSTSVTVIGTSYFGAPLINFFFYNW